MYTSWALLWYAITFKGREGFMSKSHDAYMSIDESSVKRRGQPIQSHLGQGHAMAPVSMDQGGYQAMVNSLQISDNPSRPRSQIWKLIQLKFFWPKTLYRTRAMIIPFVTSTPTATAQSGILANRKHLIFSLQPFVGCSQWRNVISSSMKEPFHQVDIWVVVLHQHLFVAL